MKPLGVRVLVRAQSPHYSGGVKSAPGYLKLVSVAVLLLLVAVALDHTVAAQSTSTGTSVPLSSLYLDQPQATFNYGEVTCSVVQAGANTNPCATTDPCANGNPCFVSGTYNTNATLTGGSTGAVLFATENFSVTESGPGQLHLNSTLSFTTGVCGIPLQGEDDWELGGIGTTFSGQYTISTPCMSWTQPVTLTLAGTGLTLGTPISTSTTSTSTSGTPTWFLEGCYSALNGVIQNQFQTFETNATSLLEAGQASVTLDLGETGTLNATLTLTFEGSGSSGSAIAPRPHTPAAITLDMETGTPAIAYHPAGAPATVTPLDGTGGPGYPAFSCSDPCVVAFDGSGASTGAIAPRPDAPAANSTDAECDFAFDGSGGSGSSVSYIAPGGAPGSPGENVQLLAAATTTSTPVPLRTEVASGQAAYVATGNSTLALPRPPRLAPCSSK